MDELDIEDAFDAGDLQQDVVWNVFADSDGHDVRARFGGVANLHAIDVDLRLAKDGGDLTDHVWLVNVWHEKEIAFRREVDAVLVDLHDLWQLAVEEGASDLVLTIGGFDTRVMAVV